MHGGPGTHGGRNALAHHGGAYITRHTCGGVTDQVETQTKRMGSHGTAVREHDSSKTFKLDGSLIPTVWTTSVKKKKNVCKKNPLVQQ